jgi:hypothetical protein
MHGVAFMAVHLLAFRWHDAGNSSPYCRGRLYCRNRNGSFHERLSKDLGRENLTPSSRI